MGLGKTIQILSFLGWLSYSQNHHGPHLIIVPLSTLPAWEDELLKWVPWLNVVTYIGDQSSRDIIKQYEWFDSDNKKMLNFNVLLTTYEMIIRESEFLSRTNWHCISVDEAHRLKNHEALLYVKLIAFKAHFKVLVTGTPLQNSLKELWALLHFIMPREFEYWEDFEEMFDTNLEKATEARSQLVQLHEHIQPFLLRRTKKDVEKSLPPKKEKILRVHMTSYQKTLYKWIITRNFKALQKAGSVSSFCNIIMELKKCCNHASLVSDKVDNMETDSLELLAHSGKMLLLDKLLAKLKSNGHRVLIFSQMVMMLDIIADYLNMKKYLFQRLDGSTQGDMRRQAVEHFNAPDSEDFCFLLSTRAGGLGINLATADTVIIFDSDWNPQNDLQAMARAHRIGQKSMVYIYRFITAQTVEEDIIERAKRKMMLDHLIIQKMDTSGKMVLDHRKKQSQKVPFTKDELNRILKFGAETLFTEEKSENHDEVNLDQILENAEVSEEKTKEVDNDFFSNFNNVATVELDDVKDWENVS